MFVALLPLVSPISDVYAFDLLQDTAAIGAAFMTHLSLHEIGHQLVAEEAGADSPKMHFMTQKNGRFYPGLSTYKNIKKESKLPNGSLVNGWRMFSERS